MTQRAFKACIETPVPCTSALAEATSQKPEDVLANWKRAEFLISDDYGREAKLGAFDPARMVIDAKFIEDNFKITISDPQARILERLFGRFDQAACRQMTDEVPSQTR